MGENLKWSVLNADIKYERGFDMCEFLDDLDDEFVEDDNLYENTMDDCIYDDGETESRLHTHDSIIDDISIADSILLGGIGGLIYEDISKVRERRKRRRKDESEGF